MRDIFFPLASNINCFQSKRKRLNIEGRIKQALLIYDRLCYEDGRYDLTVWEHGSIGGHTLPERLSDRDAEFRYFDRPVRNKPFVVAVAHEGPDGTPKDHFQPIIGGPIDYQFIACYRGLIEEIVNEGGDPGCFLPIPHSDLRRDIERVVIDWAKSDTRDSEISKAFSRYKQPGARWLKKNILENLNRDVLVSTILEKPLSLDQLHLRVLRKRLEQQQDTIKTVTIRQGLVLDAILQTRIPDLSKLPWSAIFDVRASRAWESFRQLLGDIAQQVSEHYDTLDDSRRFHEESKKYFLELWTKEVTDRESKLFPKMLSSAIKKLGLPQLVWVSPIY